MAAHASEVVLERMTWQEAQAATEHGRVLIIPVGATEQHGPHLPLGTDAIVAFELACRVARVAGALVAPAIYFAARSSPRSGGGGRSFPGSTGVTGRTLINVAKDVTDEFFRTGFRHIAYLNGHYENTTLLYEALTEVLDQHPSGHKAILVNWWEQLVPADVDRIFGDNFPGWEAEHAGVAETSLMEELRPDLVRADAKGQGGVARMTTYDIFPPPPDVIPPTGLPWRSDLANAETGKYLADALTIRISDILAAEFPASASGSASPGPQALSAGPQAPADSANSTADSGHAEDSGDSEDLTYAR
jgi:creatinine amidohydrolase